MDQMKIGRFLAGIRKEKELTQSELAERVGVTDRAISKWENGRGLPDYDHLQSLCEELDITFKEFFRGERLPNEKSDIVSSEVIADIYKEQERTERRRTYITIVLFTLLMIGLFVHYLKRNRPVHSTELWYGVIRYIFDGEDRTKIEGTTLYIDLISFRYGEVTLREDTPIAPELEEKILRRETWIPVKVFVEIEATRDRTVYTVVSIEEIEPNDYMKSTMLNRSGEEGP